ncbi:hypothetical protein ANCCAN_24874 [Ancylostoma caninum]|uniref:Uncharacterized protein n=1 Tax=Ancylostoma caninum TaxID=29170 RepID=A0A368FEQ7_ANCCA|nr:hypothetical protein ANCCAN_24874 [Ancylostoma caninum]
MRSILETVDFSLSTSLCVSQLLFTVLRSIMTTFDASVAAGNSFEEFMCSFWFLALCGCLTKRRYIIVFTTMAMFYSFVLAFKWATAAHYSYFNGTQLSCTRAQRHGDSSWCKNADLMLVLTSIIAVLITMTAAVLSALRLWSEEEETKRPQTLLPSASAVPTKQPMISTFRNSIDQQ